MRPGKNVSVGFALLSAVPISTLSRHQAFSHPLGCFLGAAAQSIHAMTSALPETRLTRGMKQAATVMDSFSIRLGIFLRRYPAARVFVLFYMVRKILCKDGTPGGGYIEQEDKYLRKREGDKEKVQKKNFKRI